MELEQLDMKIFFFIKTQNKYLRGVIRRFMKKKKKKNHVCMLKQSPRQQYKKFDQFIPNLGYSRSLYDNYIYMKKIK